MAHVVRTKVCSLVSVRRSDWVPSFVLVRQNFVAWILQVQYLVLVLLVHRGYTYWTIGIVEFFIVSNRASCVFFVGFRFSCQLRRETTTEQGEQPSY